MCVQLLGISERQSRGVSHISSGPPKSTVRISTFPQSELRFLVPRLCAWRFCQTHPASPEGPVLESTSSRRGPPNIEVLPILRHVLLLNSQKCRSPDVVRLLEIATRTAALSSRSRCADRLVVPQHVVFIVLDCWTLDGVSSSLSPPSNRLLLPVGLPGLASFLTCAVSCSPSSVVLIKSGVAFDDSLGSYSSSQGERFLNPLYAHFSVGL